MALLNKKYRELKPADQYIADNVVLAQAWKKSQQYIRSTNWYANTFELDRSTLSLAKNLDLWVEELEGLDYELTPLRLVPAPKSTSWVFVDTPLFPPANIEFLDWEFAEENLSGINQSWVPKDEVVIPLRPLAHVPIKEQTYFTALMMCLANTVETIQGDTSSDFESVHEKKVVNYGNRLYCQYKDGEAQFPWGNSTIYSKYFTDYQRFLERPSYFGKQAIDYKSGRENVYEIHLDLSRFYDCIDRRRLTEEIVSLIDGYTHKRFPIIDKLLDEFEDWKWEDDSISLYNNVCQKDSEDIPLGVPQGLVSGGFLSNIYLLNFDAEMAEVIGQVIDEKYRVVDFCRYVDDMRLIIVSEESSTNLKKDIVDFINSKLEDIGLSIHSDKTKVEPFQIKKVGISGKLRSIQGKVSGPISNNEIDEQLGHLEGLINLADYIKTLPKDEDSNNPLALIEAPNHDVREDTLVRFSANKIHNLLQQKRNFYTQEVDNTGKPKPGNWDYLQERMARKFIACWTKDPSLVLLLKKGLELFPNTAILKTIITQFKYVISRQNSKQTCLVEYCLCEIFRHSATIIHQKSDWEFPTHSNRADYFEYLQCIAIDILQNSSAYSFNVREQARFLLLVRNDNLLGNEDAEDKDFNVVIKIIKGFRSIANDMSHQEFISNSLLAYQLSSEPELVIRSLSSFLEKVNKKGGLRKLKKSLNKRNLTDVLENLAIESSTLFSELVKHGAKNNYSWQQEHSYIIKKSGIYQKSVEPKFNERAYPLLALIKHVNNPLSHENAILHMLKVSLEEYDFSNAVDLANTKVECSNWDEIQTLDTNLKINIQPDDSPLFGVPDWVLDEHRPLYHVGMFIRSCLIGDLDWTGSNRYIQENGQYTGIKSGFIKRQFGLMHSPESLNGQSAPMSGWLTNLLFQLLQWPGLQLNGTESEWPKVWNIKTLLQLIEKRINYQKNLFCKLSMIPGYIEKVNLNWNKDKQELDVVMVQSLLPQKSDFLEHGLMLDTPEYRVKHRRHVAAVAELILHKKYSHETVGSDITGKIDLIVWPELAVNDADIDILKRLSDKTGAMIFTGLNFANIPNVDGPNNVAKWIIPNKRQSGRSFIERLQGKQFMMKDEVKHIKPWRPYQLFIELIHPAFKDETGFRMTGSICFDSTDIKMSADLKGKSNAYLIPALNMDVNTFDSMVDALFYHMYQHVVLVNTGEFGGSVAKAPYKERHEKLITHVHGAQQVSISSFKMNMFDFREIGNAYNSGKKLKTKPAGNV